MPHYPEKEDFKNVIIIPEGYYFLMRINTELYKFLIFRIFFADMQILLHHGTARLTFICHFTCFSLTSLGDIKGHYLFYILFFLSKDREIDVFSNSFYFNN